MNPIASLRQKKAKALDQMKALNEKAFADAARAFTEDEQKQYDALQKEVETDSATIARMEKFAEEQAKSATTVTGQPHVEVAASGSEVKKREPGVAVARFIRSLAAGRMDPMRAADFAEKTLHDGEVAKALSAGTGSGGGFLIPTNYAAELIEFLRPASVLRKLGARVYPLNNGNALLPKVTGGATATYIGENQNIGATEPTFGSIRLTGRKLAALVPISNDLIRFSNPAADEFVRTDLVAAIAQAEDLNFLRGDGTGAGPKGLRYWAPTANILTVNATVNLANVDKDLGKLMLALQNANVRMIDPGWIMSPRTKVFLETLRDGNGNKAYPEIEQGKLRGYKFATTTQIPINLAVTDTAESELYFVDFADVIIGEALSLMIDVSSEAAYHNGSAVVAAYSLDQTVIRVITENDLAVRHAEAVALFKDVDWA